MPSHHATPSHRDTEAVVPHLSPYKLLQNLHSQAMRTAAQKLQISPMAESRSPLLLPRPPPPPPSFPSPPLDSMFCDWRLTISPPPYACFLMFCDWRLTQLRIMETPIIEETTKATTAPVGERTTTSTTLEQASTIEESTKTTMMPAGGRTTTTTTTTTTTIEETPTPQPLQETTKTTTTPVGRNTTTMTTSMIEETLTTPVPALQETMKTTTPVEKRTTTATTIPMIEGTPQPLEGTTKTTTTKASMIEGIPTKTTETTTTPTPQQQQHSSQRQYPPSPPSSSSLLDPMVISSSILLPRHQEPESPSPKQPRRPLKRRKIDETDEETPTPLQSRKVYQLPNEGPWRPPPPHPSPPKQFGEQPIEVTLTPPQSPNEGGPPPSPSPPPPPSPQKQSREQPIKKTPTPLEYCLKLLRQKDDEHRLEGLRLLPIVCPSNDHSSIHKVYATISSRFIHRLFRYGIGDNGGAAAKGQRVLCLKLYIQALQLFSRIPDIAANEYMVSKIPSILQIMKRESSPRVLFLCYDTLYHVLSESEHGVTEILQAGGADVLVAQLPSLTSGSHKCTLCAIGLLELIFCDVSRKKDIIDKYLNVLLTMVSSIARLVALLENDHKFDLLYLMSFILSSESLTSLHEELRLEKNDELQTYIRAGVVYTLQYHKDRFDKWTAILVANCLVSLMGEIWLVGEVYASDAQSPIPGSRLLFLVAGQCEVEMRSLLDSSLEARKSSRTKDISYNVDDLHIAFFLVEKIIQLALDIKKDDGRYHGGGELICEILILELEEIIGLVLEYINNVKVLQDGRWGKGDDLAYAVKLVGKYLGNFYNDVPLDYLEKAVKLVDFMWSVEPAAESSNYSSALVLLPVLCRITSDTRAVPLLSSKVYRDVVIFLPEILHRVDDSAISYGSRILLNLLLEQQKNNVLLDGSAFVRLLETFAIWIELAREGKLIVLASSICSLIFEATSEEYLVGEGISRGAFQGLSQLVVRSIEAIDVFEHDDGGEYQSLKDIIVTGYSRWCGRFPSISEEVGDVCPF